MLKQPKTILKVLAVCLLIGLNSCTNDLYEDAIQPKSELTIKKVSLRELSKTDNAKLFKTVDLISLDNKKEHSKIVYDSKNKFYFDDANGKVIESADGHKSFTFQIYTNDSLAKIENVLFTEKGNGEYDAYRVKYDFTEKELATLSKEQLSKQKVEYTYITSSKPNKTSKASYNCLEISEWISYPAYQGDLRGEFRNDGEWVTIAVVCGKTNTEIQPGTDNSTSNSGWSTGNFNSTSSGSTNGNTTAGGVYTSPVVSPGLQFVNSLNFDTKDNILILSNEAQKIVFDYLTANGFNETSKAKAKYVLDRFNFSWIGDQPAGTDVALFNYLSQNGFSSESGSFVNQMIELLQQDSELNSNALKFILQAQTHNKIKGNLDESFLLSVDNLLDIDLASNPEVIDPLMIHFTIQCAVLRANHPSWSDTRIYWEASKELVHISLDVLGLVPVVGEVADLTNGVLYTIEGDDVNATLSVVSAVPLVGWASVSTKYAIKITATVSGKTKLVWKVTSGIIEFGNRSQLRKVLNLATGNPLVAHHIIPWAKSTNATIQKAAKSAKAFHMNEVLNGIPLTNAVHNGSHAVYDAKIVEYLEKIPTSATPDQAYDEVIKIINKVKIAIQNNPNTPINQLIF
jgi:hypothetical protein